MRYTIAEQLFQTHETICHAQVGIAIVWAKIQHLGGENSSGHSHLPWLRIEWLVGGFNPFKKY